MRKTGGRLRLEGRERNGDVSPQISLCRAITDTVVVLGGGGHWAAFTNPESLPGSPAWQLYISLGSSNWHSSNTLRPRSCHGLPSVVTWQGLHHVLFFPLALTAPLSTVTSLKSFIQLLLSKVHVFSARTRTAHHFLFSCFCSIFLLPRVLQLELTFP